MKETAKSRQRAALINQWQEPDFSLKAPPVAGIQLFRLGWVAGSRSAEGGFPSG